MIGQHGRGQSGYEVGLSGRKFDHHGLLLPRGPCARSVSPSLPPQEIVLGSYVINFNICNVLFTY